MSASPSEILDSLSASGLVSDDDLRAVNQPPVDVQSCLDALVRRGSLTPFQAQAVRDGEQESLVFGEYLVLDRIGAGGMGEVFKAIHRRMDRLVAVKRLPAILMKSPAAVQRFYREVKAAARLHHPNIVAAYDAGEAHGAHYLVMEFVDGPDLSALLKQHGKLSTAQAVDVLLQAATGLAYAHAKGIIHRDIKPANMLLDSDGTVKLLDMGLARFEQVFGEADGELTLTHEGRLMGTVEYMAPEQAADAHSADARADIYSLGCTLYRALTGKLPYGGTTAVQKIMAHSNAPIPTLLGDCPEVPQSLDALYQRMIAKRPADRPQSMNEVVTALGKLISSGAVERWDRYTHIMASAPILRSVPSSVPDNPTTDEHSITRTQTEPMAPSEAMSDPEADTLDEEAHHSLISDSVVAKSAPASSTSQPPARVITAQGEAINIADIPLAKPSRRREQEASAKSASPAKDIPKAQPNRRKLYITIAASALALIIVGLLIKQYTGNSDPIKSPVVADTDRASVIPNAQPETPVNPVIDTASTPAPPSPITNTVGMKLIWIKPGSFDMGSAEGEPGREADEVLHRVTLTKGFYIGTTEVTQAQWNAIMGHNPSAFLGDNLPVENVSWDDANEFCRRLSEKEGKQYRLPTEAQWEYACRAGTTTSYYVGNGNGPREMGTVGWYKAVSEDKTHPVGLKKPNSWGLYDMHGNVFEWCSDGYGPYPTEPVTDPIGPVNGNPSGKALSRIMRGGQFNHVPHRSRSAYRGRGKTGELIETSAGLRVVMDDSVAGSGLTPVVPVTMTEPPLAKAPFDAPTAKKHQQAWADYLGLPVEKTVDLPGGEKMIFMLIPPGEFMMGTSEEENAPLIKELTEANSVTPHHTLRDAAKGLERESPQHRVRITQPFYFGKYEVTQAQWRSVMGSSEEITTDKPDHPVGKTVMNQILQFLKKLDDSDGDDASTYMLPTEAQWEYACRAGTTTPWYTGDKAEDLKLAVPLTITVAPVGQFKPNAFGLYDMHGNVIERCWELWSEDYYSKSPVDDPGLIPGPNPGIIRHQGVIRGGCALEYGSKVNHILSRSAYRRMEYFTAPYENIGFRAVLTIDAAKKKTD